MQEEYTNYFSSKRSEYQNAIIGIGIGLVLGFSSILTAEATRTILALVSFLALAVFLILFFYQKHRFNEAWELFAFREDSKEKMNGEIEKNYYNKKYPSTHTGKRIDSLWALLTPRNVWTLIAQCTLWGVMIAIFILWTNSSIGIIKNLLLSHFYNLLEPVLDLTRTAMEKESGIGPRHILFGVVFLLSNLVMVFDSRGDQSWSKSLFGIFFIGGYAVMWSSILALSYINSPNRICSSQWIIIWIIEILLLLFLLIILVHWLLQKLKEAGQKTILRMLF